MNPETVNTSPDNTKSAASKTWMYTKFALKALGIFALAYLILVPIIQPLLVRLYANLPFFLIALGGLVGGIIIGTKNSKDGKTRIVPWTVLILSVFLLGGIAWCTNNVQWIVEWQMSASMDVEKLGSMPLTNTNRVVPRATALDLIKSGNDDNRLKAVEPHVIMTEKDGKSTVWWQGPMPYDIWYGKIFGSVRQVIMVDAKEMEVDVKSGANAFFLFGPDSFVRKILFRLRHPFSKEAEVVYWRNEATGRWTYLQSYTSYKMTWTMTMVPTISGVMEFGPHGGFSNYSVAAAAKKFKGASLYPPALGEAYAKAYAEFHNGVDNYWTAYKGIYEVAEDDNAIHGGNRFPYFQDLEGMGLQQVVAFEPKGPNAYALKELLFFDAITGKVKSFVPHENVPLVSPRKAIHDGTKADFDTPWNNYQAVEPLLVNCKAGTYWLVFYVRSDKEKGSSVLYVLVDARDRKNPARKFNTSDELFKFLGEPVSSQK